MWFLLINSLIGCQSPFMSFLSIFAKDIVNEISQRIVYIVCVRVSQKFFAGCIVSFMSHLTLYHIGTCHIHNIHIKHISIGCFHCLKNTDLKVLHHVTPVTSSHVSDIINIIVCIIIIIMSSIKNIIIHKIMIIFLLSLVRSHQFCFIHHHHLLSPG